MSYEQKDEPNEKKPGGNNPKKNFWTPLIIALALVLLFAGRLVYDYAPYSAANQRLLTFLLTTAILSLGLGLFNLIPIPPLDGSKVLFSLLPDRAYNTMLRYERYGMLLLWAVVLLGVGDRWMSAAIQWTYELFCRVVGF